MREDYIDVESDDYYDAFYKYLLFVSNKYNLYVANLNHQTLSLDFVKVTTITSDYRIIYSYGDLSFDDLEDSYYLIGNVLINYRDIDIHLYDALGITEEQSNRCRLINNCCYDDDIEVMANAIKSNKIHGPIYSDKTNNKLTNLIESNGGNKMSISNVLGLKMVMSIINSKGELDLSKLLIAQSLSKGENIEVSEIMKTKMMETLMKGTKSKEELPLEKLMVINMLEDGNVNLNQLIQYKMMNSMLNDDSSDINLDKMMMIQCMTNGGDMSDIIKYKMMLKLFDEED